MKSYRGVLRWLFAAGVLGALMALPAMAAPNVSAECFAVRVDDSTEAGTEQTWFVFRAVVSPSADTSNLVGTPNLHLGVQLVDATNGIIISRRRVTMERDMTRSSFGRDTFWIAFVRGNTIPDLADGHTVPLSGSGRTVSSNWAVEAWEVDSQGTASMAASDTLNVNVYPSVRDTSSGQWAVELIPVDASGNDDIAPGPGQNGNGLRVDPQDDTRPNDGGGAHRFTWRVRVRTLGGLPPGLFQRPSTFDYWNLWFGNQDRYDRLRSGVLLYLVDPAGNVRVSPMQAPEIDPLATYPTEGPFLHPQANQALASGVIYSYTMEPTEFWWDGMATFFGGDLQSMSPQFTVPDGLPTIPLGGGIGTTFTGRPFANVYASFNELDSTILYAAFMSPPPPMPIYSTGVGGRAGQWGYYIRSSIDFRPDPAIGNDQNADNFLATSVGDPPNRRWTDYRENWGQTPTRYRRLQDSDEPDPRNVDAEIPYVHPYVTPILVDGHWTDDLIENRNLQKPPNYLLNIEPWPPYNDPTTTLASNARRSRVTTKTKVRFQVRVVHVPQVSISGPLTVRVWIGSMADGSMRPYMMQVAPNQGAIDYAQGVLYYYDTVLGPGNEGRHAIYFEADDGVNRCIWPRRPADDPQGASLPNRNDALFFGSVNRVGKNYMLEPWVNNRPELSGGKVTPSSGVLGTSFVYEVLYRDADNDPPADAWVIINNKPEHWRYRMTEAPEDAGNSYAQGRRYRLVLNQLPGVPLNKYNFYFQFRDNWATSNRPIRREFGEWVTFPQGDDSGNPSNVIEGPTIIANSAPELREVSVAASDTAYNSATKYDFFVRYRDADNNAPNSLKIFIELYDSATGQRLTTDPGTSLIPSESGTNYASGVQYHLAAPIRLAPAGLGQEYRFRFGTSDGVDQTNLVTVGTGATSLQLNTARVLRMVAPTVYDDPAGTRAWVNDPTLFVWLTSGGVSTLLAPGDFSVDSAAGRITIPTAGPNDVVRVSYRYEQTVGPVVNENVVPVLDLPDAYDKPLNYKTISQTTGDTTTIFQFAIDYTDADNQPPILTDGVTEGVYLVVDNNTRFPLQRDPNTPTPVDYRTKVRYIGGTALPIGHHVYHFEATDGAGMSRRPLLADDVDGNGDPIPADLPVVVTSTASLTDLTIEPFPKGRSNQLYQFTVTYRSQDDRAPEDSGRGPIELWVSDTTGANYTYTVMTAIDPIVPGAYQNGVRFRAQLTAPSAPLEPGQHTITVGFQGDRTQSYVPYQQLLVNDKPVLSDWSVAPNPATAAQDVVFSVKYTDAMLGDAPSRMELQINRQPVAVQPVSTPANPTVADYKAGVVYTWTIPGSTIGVGSHIYQFLASDDTEPADPVPAVPAAFQIDSAGIMTLSDGSVTPDRGNQANTYVYSVKYTHSDNIAPYRIQVIVNPSGVPLIYDLKPKTGDPLDYVNGVIYESDPQRLPPGTHAFRFEAQDRFQTVLLPPTGELSGPKVNFPPELSTVEVTKVGSGVVSTVGPNNQLTPQLVGTLNDRYLFRITYRDIDQNNPNVPEADHYVHLILNEGTPRPMVATSNDYANGVVYELELSNIDPGDIQFRFVAFDGPGAMGDTVQLPAGGSNITNMSVRNIPVLAAPGPSDPNTNDGTLDPIAGIRSTIYRYRVKYTHLDNTAPQSIQLVIDEGQASEKTVNLTPQGSGPFDYRTGVIYGYDTTSMELAVGAHTYSFRATDGLTPASLNNLNGPTVSNALLALSAPTDGTLKPQLGPPSTDFTYQVIYTNADNNAPQYVRVLIDGVAHDMTRATTSTDYRVGVLYEFKFRFPRDERQRNHSYRFEAKDTVSDAVVRYPAAGDLAGPTLNTAYFVITGVSQPPAGPGGPIVVGGTVTVQGRLDTNSPIGAQQVAVQLVKPDGSGATASLTTAADGAFTYTSSTTLDQTGDWKVKLDWIGVPGTYDAAAAEASFKVTGTAVPLAAGVLDMISLPIVPVTPDPSLTFNPVRSNGSTAPVSVLDLVVWSPTVPPNGKYVSLNRDATFPGAGGGRAYWTLPTEAVTLNPRGKIWDQTLPYTIGVAPGWNMIGSVFNQDINWGAVQVRFQGNVLPLANAGDVLRPYAWGYNPTTGGYTLIQSGGVLKPGRGYWVRVLQPCEIILPTPGTKAAAGSRDADVTANAIQVTARLDNRLDADNYLSLSPATRAFVEKPPFVGEYASIQQIPATEVAGQVPTRAGQTVVAFEAVTNKANADVTLAFPNVAVLGRKAEITLVDLATNTTRALATSGTYVFNSGENAGARRFALLVRPVTANSRLVISDLKTTGRSAGSLAFAYTLSGPATVRAQIVGSAGNVVRTLSQGRSATEGANVLLWDGRDQKGISVPSGTYLVKLTATDGEGRAATAILPVTLVR
ncbi:MAG: hypothetical protein GX446_01730 [Chthonomonadales bacterium]|nr:hypothetical protein [Chthonomonadales bacterium]